MSRTVEDIEDALVIECSKRANVGKPRISWSQVKKAFQSDYDLPPARREKYEQSGRNSKVLVKKLK
ncbi:MAG TPA: hypothetical protein VIK59_08165 [Verrucomicrobiae bacterium]